jgi:hypothetical protein
MSETIYGWLLRLYPSRFREEYGYEALQLFHDRLHNETGALPTLRLWLDLLADLAFSIPVEHRRMQLALAGAAAHRSGDGTPAFRVLEAEPPRLGAQFSAGLLSSIAFAALILVIASGGNPRLLRAWFDRLELPTEQSPASKPIRFAAAFQASQAQGAALAPQPATKAVIEAFKSHNLVLFGEAHGNKQEYEWLSDLVHTPEFADRVDDIVVEFGNSLYQKSVDRYVAGENVPLEQVQKAWRNTLAVGPPSPVYAQFYQAVRDANLHRRGKHQLRIVLGDPYEDWEKAKDAEDLGPFVANRDQWYAQVVKDEVLARNHRALLIMGWGHFLRRNGPGFIEHAVREAGASTWLVVLGTDAVGGYDDLDKRFDSFPRPSIVSLSGTWAGDLPVMPVVSGGTAPASTLKLADAADALLYVGSRDSLTQLLMPRAELDGTPYGAEMTRRLSIEMGHAPNFLFDQTETPMFERPHPPASAGGARPSLPPMPKSFHDPLPPRPPSQ